MRCIDDSRSQQARKQQIIAADIEIAKLLGKGSFGTVFLAKWKSKEIDVALKIVPNNPKYKNREVEVLKSLHHPNIVSLLIDYESRDQSKKKSYFNIVMEYLPTTLSAMIRQNSFKSKNNMGKVIDYSKKMIEGLAYLDQMEICHRDIKPSNILVNEQTQEVKICDFGSAKVLKKGEKSITYICSRYYRAPELILDCASYSSKVDIWSVACVIVEMMIGKALFNGNNNMDQIVKIIKVIGSPSPSDMAGMKVEKNKHELVEMGGMGLEKRVKTMNMFAPEPLIDLLSKMLVYDPNKRISAKECLLHPVFKNES